MLTVYIIFAWTAIAVPAIALAARCFVINYSINYRYNQLLCNTALFANLYFLFTAHSSVSDIRGHTCPYAAFTPDYGAVHCLAVWTRRFICRFSSACRRLLQLSSGRCRRQGTPVSMECGRLSGLLCSTSLLYRDCNPETIFQSRDFGIEKRQSRDPEIDPGIGN